MSGLLEILGQCAKLESPSGGVPCIRNLRIPVATVVDMVAHGMTHAEIVKPTPTWKRTTFAEPSGSRLKRFESEKSRCSRTEAYHVRCTTRTRTFASP